MAKKTELNKTQMKLFVNEILPKILSGRILRKKAANMLSENDNKISEKVLNNIIIDYLSKQKNGDEKIKQYKAQMEKNKRAPVILSDEQIDLIKTQMPLLINGKVKQKEVLQDLSELGEEIVGESTLNYTIRELYKDEPETIEAYKAQMKSNQQVIPKQVEFSNEQQEFFISKIDDIINGNITQSEVARKMTEADPSIPISYKMLTSRIEVMLKGDEERLLEYRRQKQDNRDNTIQERELSDTQIEFITTKVDDVINGKVTRKKLLEEVSEIEPSIKVTEYILNNLILEIIGEDEQKRKKYDHQMKTRTKATSIEMIEQAQQLPKIDKWEFLGLSTDAKIKFIICKYNKTRIDYAKNHVAQEESKKQDITEKLKFFLEDLDNRKGKTEDQKYNFTEDEVFLMFFVSPELACSRSITRAILPGINRLEQNPHLNTESIKEILMKHPNIITEANSNIDRTNSKIEIFYENGLLDSAIENGQVFRGGLESIYSLIMLAKEKGVDLENSGVKKVILSRNGLAGTYRGLTYEEIQKRYPLPDKYKPSFRDSLKVSDTDTESESEKITKERNTMKENIEME